MFLSVKWHISTCRLQLESTSVANLLELLVGPYRTINNSKISCYVFPPIPMCITSCAKAVEVMRAANRGRGHYRSTWVRRLIVMICQAKNPFKHATQRWFGVGCLSNILKQLHCLESINQPFLLFACLLSFYHICVSTEFVELCGRSYHICFKFVKSFGVCTHQGICPGWSVWLGN